MFLLWFLLYNCYFCFCLFLPVWSSTTIFWFHTLPSTFVQGSTHHLINRPLLNFWDSEFLFIYSSAPGPFFTLHSPAAMWSVTRPDLVRESTGSGPWIDWIWCVDPRLCLLNLLRNHLTWTYLFNMLNTTKHVFSWYYLYFLMWYKCRFYPLLCDTYVIRF